MAETREPNVFYQAPVPSALDPRMREDDVNLFPHLDHIPGPSYTTHRPVPLDKREQSTTKVTLMMNFAPAAPTRFKSATRVLFVTTMLLALTAGSLSVRAEEAKSAPEADHPKAFVDGNGPGWRTLTLDDFTNVNCDEDTWRWEDEMFKCTGSPVGVIRSHEFVTNIELVVEWRHLKSAGNSGVFLWVTKESVTDLPKGSLPHGIEVQVLDHGYTENYEKDGKKADWFTSNGDVFPVGVSDMTPFPPVAPDGKRSFPSKNLSKGVGEWNHYYVRAINGEVRLWVNGEEVSGGTGCTPSTGYLALESEGSPVEFRNLRIRELP